MLTFNTNRILLLLLTCIGYTSLFSQNTIPGKFAPVDGKTMLIIGQDLGSVAGYVNSGQFPTPAGVTMYTDLYTMAGLNDITNYDAGDIGLQEAMNRYPNSGLSVGFWMREEADGQGEDHPNGLTELVNGLHNDELDKFVDFANRNSPRPIYLRIGYEFDGPWNGYDQNRYKTGYRYIVDYLNGKGVTNVAYVWQSATWGDNAPNIIDGYYPGDDYVDYVGLSFFFYSQDFNAENLEYALQFARNKNKPMMVAEASAQYYEFDQGTYHFNGVTTLGSQGIWNQFFRDQLIPFIDDNRDVIRAVAWINADWQSQPLWANSGVHWGDTRIETDQLITTNWNNYINNGNFLHGGPNLLNDLGITNTPPPPATCNDGEQNGDETGIDCGGSCAPCDTGGGETTTKIEAEAASLSGQAQFYTDGSASGGQGVAYLDQQGNGFTINNAPAATKVELIYASQNSGSISIIVNGQDQGNLNFNSNGAWTGSYITASIDVNISAGASFQVVNQNGDQALNVDYLNFINNSDPGGNHPCTGDDIPTASVSSTKENTPGANDGSITFTFSDNAGRSNIEFSIDGGNTYPYNVPDNSGSTTVSNLEPGNYSTYVRWGNNECARSLQQISIEAASGGSDCTDCINFNQTGTSSFSNQDGAANINIQDNGLTAFLSDNTWRRTNTTYNVTANTVLEFEFQSASQGEIHGIGFDSDENLSATQIFQLYGTQNWGNRDFDYTQSGYQSFSIRVADYYTGNNMYLVLINDKDQNPTGNTSYFRNVRIYEDGTGNQPCGPGDVPSATVSSTNETQQGANDGSITFNFNDNTGRGNIEFSIDGGNTYPYNVPDNTGSTTISNLSPGTYNLFVRWGNDECAQSLNSVTIAAGNSNPPGGTTGSYLEPSTGEKMIFIGQDLLSVSDYISDCSNCPTPTGIATYVNLANVLLSGNNGALGWAQNEQPLGIDIDWGGGPLNAHSAAIGFPNSAVQIGLYLVGETDNIAGGGRDTEIRHMASFFNALSDTAFYLRVGYEFDGQWNGYSGPSYINAYRRIVDILRQEGVSNVAYVWQSCTSPIDDILDGGRENLLNYYPGDDYVDWFGMSWFLRPNETATVNNNTPSTQLFLANELVSLARERGKAVMIAEAANQGYDNEQLTNSNISSVWDGQEAQGTVSKSGTQIWNEWFVPYFDFINSNDDVIKAITYINADWDSQGLWDAPYEQGYWGDTRVQVNSTLENNWVNQITQSGWIHGSSNLNSIIGLSSKQSPDVNDLSSNKILAYPNPSTGILYVRNQGIVKLQVSDTNGRVVKDLDIESNKNLPEITLRLNDLQKGMYIISTWNKNHHKSYQKIIIE
ncbi:T9SS type A sorting domain-containing protein [Aquimarina sp. D1M17]|uniref:glycosyl hydrolase n=1 Tax=Aquimarina acroporae TaxID=2937283 RepID=UPI0020BF2BB3|nr:glycosyl hydrolase [Aquimarina acroporae]MCK8521755.1 T9SS type A sorting domain-containing protein [Aquimarina acroporae]